VSEPVPTGITTNRIIAACPENREEATVLETIIAHAGGIDEMAMILAPLAFAVGGYFVVIRPLRQDAKDNESFDDQ
jgi:hypothetical protein